MYYLAYAPSKYSKDSPNKVEMWVSHPTSTFFQHFIFSIFVYLKDFIILFSSNKEKGVWEVGTAFCHLLFKYGLSLFLGLLRNVLKFGWSLHQIILALVLSFFHYLSLKYLLFVSYRRHIYHCVSKSQVMRLCLFRTSIFYKIVSHVSYGIYDIHSFSSCYLSSCNALIWTKFCIYCDTDFSF